MRIVHVSDHLYPVLGYQETFLAREHTKAGHEVYVVTSDRYSPSIYEANKELLGGRIVGAGLFEEEDVSLWRLRTLFEIPRAIWIRGLEDKVRELNPDVVVVHGIVTFSAIRVARLKRKLANFKLIYDDHMTFDNSTSVLRILYPLFRWTFSHLIQETADALVGVADACKEFMVKRYGILPERITVIPVGADDELFRFDEAARQEIRNQLSLSESDIVFIYTGKIIPEKRLSLLIEAMKLLKSYNSLKVLLLGNGPLTHIEKMKQDIRDADLEDEFIWHDAVPNRELYKFYSAADVAVWPRGASISQREAMACGLPIIVSEGSMVTELVSRGNGLICREDAPPDLAKQMEKLLDPELRRKMGQNSRKFVEEELSSKIEARKFIELVEPCHPN